MSSSEMGRKEPMGRLVKVLVVDDEKLIRLNLRALLEDLGYGVFEAANGREGLEVFDRQQPDLVLADLRMPILDGLSMITSLREKSPETPVVVVSGTGTVQNAVDALRLGAWDYIMKPVADVEGFEFVIKRVLERAQLIRENRLYREHLEELVREQTEELRESEARYRRLLESVTSYVYTVTLKDGRPGATVHGPGCEVVTGFTPEEYAADPYLWYRMVHDDDRPLIIDLAQRILEECLPISLEHRIHHKDGTVRWVQTTLVPHRTVRGQLLSYDGIITEITERRRAEETLFQLTKRWARTFDAVPDLIAILDTDFRIVQANKAMADRLGCTPEECVGQVCYRAVHGTEAPPSFCPHQRTVKDYREHMAEMCAERLGGDFIVSTSPIYDSEGQMIGSVHVARDITDRKRTEEGLKESEERYRVAIESSNDGIVIVKDDRYIFVNQKFIKIFGYDRLEEVLGQPITIVVHPCDHKRITEFNRLRQEGDAVPSRYEFKGVRRDGGEVFIEVSATKTTYRGEMVSLAFLRDVTEHKKLEALLQQAQKMEAIGTLAGGIAHDFNNILGAIMGFTQLALYDLPEGSPLQHKLDQVLKASERARDLVNQILAFSRQNDREMKPTQILPVIKEGLKLLRASLPKTIEIKKRLAVREDLILGDPTQIHQILMNLCTNAAQAIGGRPGLIEVVLEEMFLGAEEVGAFPGLSEGPFLRLSVRDTGEGIDPTILARIFDPFFTTKKPGEGTGMGLSVVHGIVKSHGGKITVYSEPDKGTTFNVYLPQIKRKITVEGPAMAPPPTGTERILFVDDEPGLVESWVIILERLGYKVSSRKSSLEALEAFRAAPEAFDLVITDQTMPQMSGAELARKMLTIRPDLPIILCSGFSETITPEEARAMGIRRFLMKPILMGEIATAIRKVLEGEDG